jgi:flagellar motor switch/type III secretory pathway protein FliN
MTSADASATPLPVLIPPAQNQQGPDPLARAYDLPCTVVLEMPAVDFSVGTLLALRPGSIVATASQQNEDLALMVNGQLVGMAEVDVVGNRLAVRLTGLA